MGISHFADPENGDSPRGSLIHFASPTPSKAFHRALPGSRVDSHGTPRCDATLSPMATWQWKPGTRNSQSVDRSRVSCSPTMSHLDSSRKQRRSCCFCRMPWMFQVPTVNGEVGCPWCVVKTTFLAGLTRAICRGRICLSAYRSWYGLCSRACHPYFDANPLIFRRMVAAYPVWQNMSKRALPLGCCTRVTLATCWRMVVLRSMWDRRA